jgi:hypothetical protein
MAYWLPGYMRAENMASVIVLEIHFGGCGGWRGGWMVDGRLGMRTGGRGWGRAVGDEDGRSGMRTGGREWGRAVGNEDGRSGMRTGVRGWGRAVMEDGCWGRMGGWELGCLGGCRVEGRMPGWWGADLGIWWRGSDNVRTEFWNLDALRYDFRLILTI